MRRMKLLFRKQQAVSNERLRLSGSTLSSSASSSLA
eukprot:CAMPEP_0180403926 /NCGR_PEP_ID=MMETSP0989-20121125/39706_1 /TAXON_ID=697907 /ORGANISM="non described non described, Strain CCMP2293" /LENGTH=35 /DNA_ID= /DNA_START= /DNA_END= /DNA_ORIENTATION=